MGERSASAIKVAELQFAQEAAETRATEATARAKELDETVTELRASLDA